LRQVCDSCRELKKRGETFNSHENSPSIPTMVRVSFILSTYVVSHAVY